MHVCDSETQKIQKHWLGDDECLRKYGDRRDHSFPRPSGSSALQTARGGGTTAAVSEPAESQKCGKHVGNLYRKGGVCLLLEQKWLDWWLSDLQREDQPRGTRKRHHFPIANWNDHFVTEMSLVWKFLFPGERREAGIVPHVVPIHDHLISLGKHFPAAFSELDFLRFKFNYLRTRTYCESSGFW